ncbi:MAG: arginine--tRNA ligase [Bacteroidales bacterium]|nr:arginine--tRNA ligase [Bacteroidales bacterium]
MIEYELQQSVSDALKQLYNHNVAPENIVLQKTKKEFEGDFTIVVFPYVKAAKKSPEAVANELGEYVKTNLTNIESYNVIKGFLNFVVKTEYWLSFVKDNVCKSDFGYASANISSSPIVIEYSSPNTNKPLHLGHIRNNLLGWSVAKLLQAAGNNVKKVNLVNDRGIHICKSMLAWKLYGNGETPQSSGMKGDHLVGKYYVLFDKHYKDEVKQIAAQKNIAEDEAAKESPLMLEAQDMLRRWEAKDPEIVELWTKMNGWVYEGFDATYKKMGIDFDKIYYESNTYLLGKELVTKGLEKGVLFRKEDGSVWADLTDKGLDQKLLLRKDGTSVYMTQDLGTALLRHNDFDAKQLIYVVGNEQDYHFNVLKIILERLSFDWAEKIYHLSYGMVELPNGKMKSREGTVVDADDLIEEMIATAEAMSKEHGRNNDLPTDEAQKLYAMLALGALKYFILKVDPKRNMLFNPEESIDFNGNTGPFIQYTHARIRSIIRKAQEQHNLAIDDTQQMIDWTIADITAKEKEIIKAIYDMPNVILEAANNYSPAMVANYVYDVAKSFNSFYQDTPILKETNADNMVFRLYLCKMVSTVVRNSMAVLGIEVPEKM